MRNKNERRQSPFGPITEAIISIVQFRDSVIRNACGDPKSRGRETGRLGADRVYIDEGNYRGNLVSARIDETLMMTIVIDCTRSL